MEHLSSHLAAMRRQTRRLLWTTVLACCTLLPAGAVVLITPRTGWLSALLGVLLAGYLFHLVRQVIWARRTEQQFGLEAQFVCHGPAPESVRPCLRRRNHLWISSLTLKGLKTLSAHPPAPVNGSKQRHLQRVFLQALDAVRPSWVPSGLVWLALLIFCWIWATPEAVFTSFTVTGLLGAALVLMVLLAEVIRTVLQSDVRAGVHEFAALLGDWASRRTIDEMVRQDRPKQYRHVPLYRPAVASGLPLSAATPLASPAE